MSFIKIIKSFVPRWDPCGTSDVTSTNWELILFIAKISNSNHLLFEKLDDQQENERKKSTKMDY